MINYQRSEVRGQRREKTEERNDEDSRWLSEVEATNINKKIRKSVNQEIGQSKSPEGAKSHSPGWSTAQPRVCG